MQLHLLLLRPNPKAFPTTMKPRFPMRPSYPPLHPSLYRQSWTITFPIKTKLGLPKRPQLQHLHPRVIPPTVSNSRHYHTRLPVPSPSAPPAPAVRSSTVSTLPSAPLPPHGKTSVGRSPHAHNQPTFPKHNSNIPAPTVHSKPTVQPLLFPPFRPSRSIHRKTSIFTVTCRKKYCACNSTRYNRNSVP